MSKVQVETMRQAGYLPLMEVSKLLGVSHTTVYYRILSGAVEACREGKFWYVRVASIPHGSYTERLLNRLETAFSKAAKKQVKELNS